MSSTQLALLFISCCWMKYTACLKLPDYLLVSSRVIGTESSRSNGGARLERNLEDCTFLELRVPKEIYPIHICLRPVSSGNKVLHPNFKIKHTFANGQVKETSLEKLQRKEGLLVTGFVISVGYSYVAGTIKNGTFFGMALYEHLLGSTMKFCTISPFSKLKSVIEDSSDYDDEDLKDLITILKSSIPYPESQSIITCEDGTPPDQVGEKIIMYINQRQQVHKRKRRQAMLKRYKTQADSSARANEFKRGKINVPSSRSVSHVSKEDEEEEEGEEEEEEEEGDDSDDEGDEASKNPNESLPKFEFREKPWWMRGVHTNDNKAWGGKTNLQKSPFAPAGRAAAAVNSAASADASTTSKQPEAFTGPLFVTSPGGRHVYLEVVFIVDKSLIKKYFTDLTTLTTLLRSYVDITDWVTRSHDFNGDGKPDNIGFQLKMVDLVEHKNESKSAAKNFRGQIAESFFQNWAKEATKSSIHIAIVSLNSPVYLFLGLTEGGNTFAYDGCTACAYANMLDGAINVNAAQYSPRGETMRLLHAIMRILITAMVYTKEPCLDCTAKDFGITAEGGDSWGACLVEGSLFDLSVIPMNTFRLSNCSIKQGQECLQEIANRKVNAGSTSNDMTCFQKETESNYCGNGIVEPGEECDCGTLATCHLQRCKCGPRNGALPCMKLSGAEVQVCEALIKCRGFRFLYELGQLNGSYFLDSLPAFMQSRIPRSSGVERAMQLENILFFLSYSIHCYFR